MNSRDTRGQDYCPRKLARKGLNLGLHIISWEWGISKRYRNIEKKTRSGWTNVSSRIEDSIKSIFSGKKGKLLFSQGAERLLENYFWVF